MHQIQGKKRAETTVCWLKITLRRLKVMYHVPGIKFGHLIPLLVKRQIQVKIWGKTWHVKNFFENRNYNKEHIES